MKKISIDQKIFLGFYATVLLLGFGLHIVFNIGKESRNASRLVDHAQQVLVQTKGILVACREIETSSRGFVITGNDEFLELLDSSIKSVNFHITQAFVIAADNPDQQSRLNALKPLVKQKIDNAIFVIETRRTKGFQAASDLVSIRTGKRIMDEIQNKVSQIENEEQSLLERRQKVSSRHSFSLFIVIGILTLSVVALLVAVFLAIRFNLNFRSESEEKTNRANRFLNTILENIPDMIFVKDGTDLRFVRFNKAGEKLLGIPKEDLIGKNDFDFFPKEQAEFFTGKDKDVLSKGQLLDIPEEIISTKDGERWLHTKKIPVLAEDGKSVYLLGISEDITERKKFEDEIKRMNATLEKKVIERTSELERSEKKFKALIENSHEAIALIDGNFQVFYRSPAAAKITGVSDEDRLKITGFSALHPEDKERLKMLLDEVKKNHGQTYNITFRTLHGDGHYIWMEGFFINLLNDESVKAIVANVRDVTDKKKAEDKLRFKIQELNTFIYRTSHDLRGPLTSLMGLSNLARVEIKEPAALRYFEMVRSSTQRLDEILVGLIHLIQVNDTSKEISEINFNELISGIISSLEHYANEAGTKFQIDIRQTEPFRSEKNFLISIMLNLIDNAIKYSKPGGQIEVTFKATAKNALIKVADKGIGIAPEHCEKVFDLFFRANDSTRKGTGLGLYIVKKAIERLGGTIEMESTPGEGTCFTIQIPNLS